MGIFLLLKMKKKKKGNSRSNMPEGKDQISITQEE